MPRRRRPRPVAGVRTQKRGGVERALAALSARASSRHVIRVSQIAVCLRAVRWSPTSVALEGSERREGSKGRGLVAVVPVSDFIGLQVFS